MRYIKLWAPVAFLLAAGAIAGQGQENQAKEYKNDWYPLAAGAQWHYKAKVNDAPAQKVTVTAEKPEAYEMKTGDKKDKSEYVVRYPLKIVSGAQDKVEYVAVLKDGVYRFATAGKEITPPLCFLKLPTKAGESWMVAATSENEPLTGTFVCQEDTVQVPKGKFNALRVSSKDFRIGSTGKMDLAFWFAQGVGVVKQEVSVGNSKVTLELEDYKQGK
jgi:hypothetical protein